MRYDGQHKERTRERVLKEAARAIRTRGPHRIAVAEVMAQAGLTHGGFYAHFKSKDDLVAASIGRMFEDGGARMALSVGDLPPAEGLARYIDFYLSRSHRDERGHGCPLPYLSADAPRLSPEAREAFADGVAGLTEKLAGILARLGRAEPHAEASSLLAELVGALSLARADPDPERSAAILKRSRTALKARFGLKDVR